MGIARNLDNLSGEELVVEVSGLAITDLLALFESASPSLLDKIFQSANQALTSKVFRRLPHELLSSIIHRVSRSTLDRLVRQVNSNDFLSFLAHADDVIIGRLLEAAHTARHRERIVKSLPAERLEFWERHLKQNNTRWQSSDHGVEVGSRHATYRSSSEDESASMYQRRIQDVENELGAIRGRERALHDEYEQRTRKAEARMLVEQTRAQELAEQLAALQETQKLEVQARIEVKVPQYVEAAVKVLELREALYRRKAMQWSVQASCVLVVAIAAAVGISLVGYVDGTSLAAIPWQTLLFISFKGLVVLGVLGLWAKHAFTISNAYMHEAIRRSDRAHAINFGKLYLEIYGNTVERKELIDIFENWNIDSDSAFSKANPTTFDPSILDKLSDFIKSDKNLKAAN